MEPVTVELVQQAGELVATPEPPEIDIWRASGIIGWMTTRELVWLGVMATCHRRIVELGSFFGRSTRVMADNLCRGGRIIAVDNWTGGKDVLFNEKSFTGEDGVHDPHIPILSYEQLPPEVQQAQVNANWRIFEAHQRDHLEEGRIVTVNFNHNYIRDLLIDPAPDMIFLDGEHSYEAVKYQIGWAEFLLEKNGGLLCGHDYGQFEGVKAAVDELLPGRSIVEKTTLWYYELCVPSLPSTPDSPLKETSLSLVGSS